MHLDVNTRQSRQARAKRRAICEICEIPLDLQSKNKGREIIPTFVRVNQRREVNLCEIQLHELYAETVLFSFPLNGRANYICRFRDLIKDAVSSTPG